MKKLLLFIGSLFCMSIAANGQSATAFFGYPLTVGDVIPGNGNVWHANQLLPDAFVSSGIEETATGRISIYPNPTQNILKIESEETIKAVEIADFSGKVLLSRQCNAANIELSLEKLSSGSYLIYVITDKERIVKKIIKL